MDYVDSERDESDSWTTDDGDDDGDGADEDEESESVPSEPRPSDPFMILVRGLALPPGLLAALMSQSQDVAVMFHDDADAIQAAVDASLRPEFDPGYVPDPAPEDAVSRLTVRTLAAPSGRCVICMEDLVAGDRYFEVPCDHVLHEACSREWFKCGRRCPTCQRDVFGNL